VCALLTEQLRCTPTAATRFVKAKKVLFGFLQVDNFTSIMTILFLKKIRRFCLDPKEFASGAAPIIFLGLQVRPT